MPAPTDVSGSTVHEICSPAHCRTPQGCEYRTFSLTTIHATDAVIADNLNTGNNEDQAMNMQSQKSVGEESMNWEQYRKLWMLTVLSKLTAAMILFLLAVIVSLF